MSACKRRKPPSRRSTKKPTIENFPLLWPYTDIDFRIFMIAQFSVQRMVFKFSTIFTSGHGTHNYLHLLHPHIAAEERRETPQSDKRRPLGASSRFRFFSFFTSIIAKILRLESRKNRPAVVPINCVGGPHRKCGWLPESHEPNNSLFTEIQETRFLISRKPFFKKKRMHSTAVGLRTLF